MKKATGYMVEIGFVAGMLFVYFLVTWLISL
jgi:hypothetical protein